MSPDITSSSNERIKWLIRLRDRRHRDAEGVFVVEGARLYGRAIDAGLSPLMTFVAGTTPGLVGDVVTVDPSVLDRASYRDRSEGLIAVFPQFDTALERVSPRSEPLILIAEGIEKPGNLGAMLRTASAAGVDALIAVGSTVDPFNPNVLRASTGAVFSVPVAVSTWDMAQPWLSQREIALVAASPDAATSLWHADLTGPVAVVIGAEDTGLSPQAAAMATRTVRIPQHETGVDSLNASVAAAIVLFEAVRQRTVG